MPNSPLVNFLGAAAVVGIVVTCVSLANAPRAHGHPSLMRSPPPAPEPSYDLPPLNPLPEETPAPARHEMTPYEQYDQAVQSYGKNVAYAEVMMLCGLQSHAWYERVETSLGQTYLTDKNLHALANRLTDMQYVLAQAHMEKAKREVHEYYFKMPRQGCARLSRETGLTSDLMSP